jgi:heptose-I-phosphate ethanolaminephosphotransferase
VNDRSKRPRRPSRRTAVACTALLILNLVLLSPVLIYDLQIGEGFAGLRDASTLFTLGLSLAWLCALHLSVRRPWQLHLLLVPWFCVTLVELFLIWQFDSRLTSSYVALLIGEAGQHAGDFFSTYRAESALLALPLIAIYGACLLAVRPLAHSAPRWLGIAALGGVAALYTATIAQRATSMSARAALLDVLAHDKSSPFGVLSQTYVAAELDSRFEERRLERARFRFGAVQRPPRTPRELHVLVIGESSRPDHWSLNGYARSTTPRLETEPRLVSFRNAVSQVALTRESVPHILTRTTLADARPAKIERSLISAFAEAGFTTFWLSTVQLDGFIGEVGDLAAEAHHRRYFEQRHDGVMLEAFDELVLADASRSKLLVVFHTQGSHFHYESRYPESFAVFPTGAGLSRRDQLVNAYDNTVLYTDYFVSQLVRRLERWDGAASLLYASDHGENLMDDERNLVGHYYNNEYDLRIAMLFWWSQEFAAAFPDKVASVQGNAQRPVSTANVFATMVDAAGLDVPGTRMGWSLLRPEVEDRRRIVRAGNRKGSVDFDAGAFVIGAASAP